MLFLSFAAVTQSLLAHFDALTTDLARLAFCIEDRHFLNP